MRLGVVLASCNLSIQLTTETAISPWQGSVYIQLFVASSLQSVNKVIVYMAASGLVLLRLGLLLRVSSIVEGQSANQSCQYTCSLFSMNSDASDLQMFSSRWEIFSSPFFKPLLDLLRKPSSFLFFYNKRQWSLDLRIEIYKNIVDCFLSRLRKEDLTCNYYKFDSNKNVGSSWTRA